MIHGSTDIMTEWTNNRENNKKDKQCNKWKIDTMN